MGSLLQEAAHINATERRFLVEATLSTTDSRLLPIAEPWSLVECGLEEHAKWHNSTLS